MRNKEIVEDLVNQIWLITEELRSFYWNDFREITLFLLSAYKDDVVSLSKFKRTNDIESLFQLDENTDSFYSDIYDVISSKLKKLKLTHLETILYDFDKLDQQPLSDNFNAVFELLLQKLNDYQSDRAGGSIQPKEVTRLIANLSDLKEDSCVYNPFAGFASYAIALDSYLEYHGQELDASTWVVGKLRLHANGKLGSSSFELADSIDKWKDKEFDLIVATPPFKLHVPRSLVSEITEKPFVSIENFLIEKGIRSLKPNGKLIAVLPSTFLFKGGRETIFKRSLVESNKIDTIISLPSGLFPNTNVSVCVIIFKTMSNQEGRVRMVNASSFFTQINPRTKVLREEDIMQLLNTNKENEHLKYVDNKLIRENDFNLTVKRYFIEKIEGSRLESFTSIVKGRKAPIDEKVKQVQIRDLKSEVFDCTLNTNEIESTLLNRSGFRIIEESCVLVATRFNALKPTFFRYTGETIAIPSSITALKLDESMVKPIYLINELYSTYVTEQLERLRVGTVQTMLRNNDLKSIVIKLASIPEQLATESSIQSVAVRFEELEEQKELLLTGVIADKTESSTSLSHVLGKPLLSINSSLENIQSALSRSNPNWKDIMISARIQYSILDAFQSIAKNIKYIQELADENTALVNISSFELKELYFLKFLSSFVRSERKSLRNNITLHLDVHQDVTELMNNQIIIKGNEQKLIIVLHNLLNNAITHAFKAEDVKNIINIEVLPFINDENVATSLNYDIDTNKSYIEVRVSNTGKAFPKDFTLKDYTRKHFSAGKNRNRGLGGYEVNEILKVHNNGRKALNISSNMEDSEYSSTVSFVIPVI